MKTHSTSILQDLNIKVCFLCGKGGNLELHHCFNGTAERKKCDQDKITCYLCPSCHNFIHSNFDYRMTLKRKGQLVWEEHYGDRQKFIKRYGRSYL